MIRCTTTTVATLSSDGALSFSQENTIGSEDPENIAPGGQSVSTQSQEVARETRWCVFSRGAGTSEGSFGVFSAFCAASAHHALNTRGSCKTTRST